MNVSVYAGSFVPSRPPLYTKQPPPSPTGHPSPRGAAVRDELFSGFSPLFIYLFFPVLSTRPTGVCAFYTRIYVPKRSGRFIFRLFTSLHFFFFGYLFIYVYGSRHTIIARSRTQRQQAEPLIFAGPPSPHTYFVFILFVFKYVPILHIFTDISCQRSFKRRNTAVIFAMISDTF